MAKEGKLLVKKVGNQKIVKSMAGSSSDQRSSSTHSSSIEKDNNNDPGPTKTSNFSIPEHIRIAWKDLAPSIGSAFSKRKWPTKHKMFTIFDNWMKELLEG